VTGRQVASHSCLVFFFVACEVRGFRGRVACFRTRGRQLIALFAFPRCLTCVVIWSPAGTGDCAAVLTKMCRQFDSCWKVFFSGSISSSAQEHRKRDVRRCKPPQVPAGFQYFLLRRFVGPFCRLHVSKTEPRFVVSMSAASQFIRILLLPLSGLRPRRRSR